MACAVTPRRDAVSRSIDERELQAPGLLVARDVGELGQRAQPARAPRRPGGELVGVGVLERVLVLRAADAAVDLQVLHRLQVDA